MQGVISIKDNLEKRKAKLLLELRDIESHLKELNELEDDRETIRKMVDLFVVECDDLSLKSFCKKAEIAEVINSFEKLNHCSITNVGNFLVDQMSKEEILECKYLLNQTCEYCSKKGVQLFQISRSNICQVCVLSLKEKVRTERRVGYVKPDETTFVILQEQQEKRKIWVHIAQNMPVTK